MGIAHFFIGNMKLLQLKKIMVESNEKKSQNMAETPKNKAFYGII